MQHVQLAVLSSIPLRMQHISVAQNPHKLQLHIRIFCNQRAEIQRCVLDMHHVNDRGGRRAVRSPQPYSQISPGGQPHVYCNPSHTRHSANGN